MSNLLSYNRNPRDLGSADYCGGQLGIFPRNSQPSWPGKRKYGVSFFATSSEVNSEDIQFIKLELRVFAVAGRDRNSVGDHGWLCSLVS